MPTSVDDMKKRSGENLSMGKRENEPHIKQSINMKEEGGASQASKPSSPVIVIVS